MPLALVIDDDAQFRELVTALLEQADCEVVAAADGVEGIAKLEESSPDLVVLDIQMPRLDGWETLKQIRARSEIPVLMLTAEPDGHDDVWGLADDYVPKLRAPAELVARVQALLRRERPAAAPSPPGAAAVDGEFDPGTLIGSYRIGEVVGRGGMSTIYRATHTAHERTIALKVLAREYAGDRVSRERFMNEWRIAAALRHPNILPVHDAGEAEGRMFLAMELIEGGDLGHKIIREGALSPPAAVRVFAQMAAALDAAHQAGLVHRDFKPANILLDAERAFLTDFGLSKLLGGTKLTAPGRMVGTAAYLSPEQIRGEQVTPRTDVYAFGCVIFEALTASTPFEAESDFVLMYAHLEREPPRLSERRPALPQAADDMVAKAMSKDADDRFASAGEALAALKSAFGYE